MLRRKLKRICQLTVNTLIPYRNSGIVYYNQYSVKYFFGKYGKEWLGLTGCGPFVCAITASTLLKERCTPEAIAEWSVEHGFYEYRHGSMHALIPEYCTCRGLKCEDLGDRVEDLILRLKDKDAMGILLCKKGTFSAGRHFVAVNMEEGAFKVYNSSNVLDCYRRFDKETIQKSLADENIYIGPIWCISRGDTK